MKNIKEQIINLLREYIDGIESHLENTYEILKIREEILNFLNKNQNVDLLLETELPSLKNLVIEVFGEEGKQKLTVDRISFIYEGSKICDDLPQLNAAKKELLSLFDELKRKVKDYDNEIERISKSNDKIIEKTKIYRMAIISLEKNEYLKDSKIISDMILNSDIKESEMYQYILFLAKFNTSHLEGKNDVEEFVLEEKKRKDRNYCEEYFEIIKYLDFSSLEEKNILPLRELENFDEIRNQLLSLFENEIASLRKQHQENLDVYTQRKLEQVKRNFIFLKDYSKELKVNKIINNQILYKLPQIKNTIIMEDFRKENFDKKDFKDIIDLLKDFKQNQGKKDEAFHNKLINTYKITKNNVNVIIISVKENTYVAIKLYRFGSMNVEKDVLERLNLYKDELELLIDELNHPVGYKDIISSNQEVEKAIFDTLTLNAKVG